MMLKHDCTKAKDIAEIMQNINTDDDIRQYEALPELNAMVMR